MALSSTLSPARDEDRVRELLGRVEEKLGHIPEAYHTLATSQTYLNDTLFNLKKHVAEGELDLKLKHMIAIAVAMVVGGPNIVEARVHEGRSDGLTDDEIAETMAVAGSIRTYNVFYTFQHLAGTNFQDMRPGFKMSVFMRPNTLTQYQVEMICMVVSAVNGCSTCVTGHLNKSIELGATHEQIEEGLRVGALIAGLSTFTKID